MTLWIYFMSTLAVIHCRPQESSPVEVEKLRVIEINPKSERLFETTQLSDSEQKELEENTKQILEKIAQVNEKQGLAKKKPKPYQYFPFGYHRSQEDHTSRQRDYNDFKFPRDPYTNPILDYIERNNNGEDANRRAPVMNYANANVNMEEVPPGHYIKRKIVHQQTMLVPSMGYNPTSMPSSSFPLQYFHNMNRIPGPNTSGMKKSDLEKQTIDNVKNIVENSQYVPSVVGNPYWQPFNPYPYQPIQNDNYRLYGPYAMEHTYRPAKQWQWPLGQYFPIIIKDPFLHMVNAMTTMVEFGSQGQGNSADSCGKHSPETKHSHEAPMEKKTDENVIVAQARNIPKESKLSYSVVESDKGAEITVSNNNDSGATTTLDIEDLQITNNENDPVKLNLTFRKSKSNHELTNTVVYNATEAGTDQLGNSVLQTLHITKTLDNSSDSPRQSPPIRDQILHDDEINDEEFEKEIEKAEEAQVSHDGNKKLFSKDNTGSGIFVHKIKVRKGGVAIAGPGGIATAGSGGTAIVGPNGFAYTHPDSLAIAGSGTKVVAVEPNISLTQVIMEHDKNKTRGNGHVPPRIGKIVAVGPVVYYNKGSLEDGKITIIPFYGGGKGQSLQIIERPDGSVATYIIQTPTRKPITSEEAINTSELENPPLPTRQDLEFGSNIRNIHQTAIKIIKLQEIAKKNGKLNEQEESMYQKNMDELNDSARNLAHLQQQDDDYSFENREGLAEWFERKKSNKKEKDKKKKEEEDKKKEEEEMEKAEQQKKEEEKNKLEEQKRKKEEEEKKEKPKEPEDEEEESEEESSDGISIGLPPEDASVAEAKPVGLAVAGEGGVAASKPIATAVVGPGGLAIARPVGTAIAGVAPDQALVPIYAEGYIAGSSKPKSGANKPDPTSELLNRIISKYHQI